MLVDSHCHLQDRQFDADRDVVLERARAAGVSAFVVIGADLESSWRAVDLVDSHSDVYATVGVHPHDAKGLDERTMGSLERLADSPKVVAVGEIGLDYYRKRSPPGAQMHCFAGDLTLALRYVQLGFMLSVPGTCTYPKADRICAVAGGIPLRWMAVETDAPYLAPQPHRGQRNEPAYLVDTVNHIAALRGDSFEEVVSRTALGAAWLFGLGDIGEALGGGPK